MSEKQFKLSEYVSPTSISYFYNQQGQMLNKEVASMLNKLYDEKVQLKEENEQLKKRNKFLEDFDGRAKTVANLKEENERLKNKLNLTAFELVDEAISMGKAVEISEMNYHEFLEYRKKKGKPMELQR